MVNPFQCARVGAGASKSLGFALVTTSDVGLCASTMRLHEDCVLDIRVCMSVSHAQEPAHGLCPCDASQLMCMYACLCAPIPLHRS